MEENLRSRLRRVWGGGKRAMEVGKRLSRES